MFVHPVKKVTGKLCKPKRVNFFSVGEYARWEKANRNSVSMRVQLHEEVPDRKMNVLIIENWRRSLEMMQAAVALNLCTQKDRVWV